MNEAPVLVGSGDRDALQSPIAWQRGFALRLRSAIEWFVPASARDDLSLIQRIHVFVVAHFSGAVLGLALAYMLYRSVPEARETVLWLLPFYLFAAALPFGFKLVPRLDVVAAISSQWFALTLILTARYYGGLYSPILPWFVLAFCTALYYLTPWPVWRTANIALQIVQLAVFVYAAIDYPPAVPSISSDRLLEIGLASTVAALSLISVISLHIWSLALAKQQELEREMAVRRAAQAERQKAEAELLRSRDHLAQSQRVGRIGSAEISFDPVYESRWSDALYELFGLEPTGLAPGVEEFLAMVHPDDRPFVRSRKERERRGDYGRAFEFRIFLPDGKMRWLRRQAQPIERRDSVPIREIVTFIDITEQKDADHTLAQLEEMLAQAQKMEAIGHLTGGIAHDFNNLLGVILGMLRLMEEELDRTVEANFDDIHDWLEACIRAVNRGSTLTKGMLAFSRRQALKPVVLDVNAVIDEMIDMSRRALGETYRIEVVKAPAPWLTEADPGQLQNSIINLLLNARDAVPAGGTLTVEVGNVRLGPDYAVDHIDVAPGDYVGLFVSDKGMGMPPDVLKQAFDPFFTTKEVGKGTGLGLSMVYGFVKQSGGHVAIESEVGKGTTVRVYLPRRENGHENEAPAGKTVRASSATARAGGTILVVEDNEDLRTVTCRQITRLGYTVIAAADAAMGIDRLRANPDTKLVVSDVMLPHGMSGVELAERVLSEFPKTPILFMSGYNEEHDAFNRIRGRTPIRLLQKPFQPSELAAQIRAMLT